MLPFFVLMWINNPWISFYIENPFKTMKKIKGIFIPLRSEFIYSKNSCPFFNVHRGKFLSISIQDIQWKDKWQTPRHEENPYISIRFFNKYYLNWTWVLPPHLKGTKLDELDYWEQALWYLYYYRNISYGRLNAPDIKKAEESWPWSWEGKSTWNKMFILNYTKDDF